MEELLASLPSKLPSFRRGEEIEGKIVEVSDKDILLDLGAKAEGVILKNEFTPSQRDNLKIGDKLTAYVIDPENEYGQMVLSLSRQIKRVSSLRSGRQFGSSFSTRGSQSWNRFRVAMEQKNKLKGRVIESNKGGLIVEIDGIRGFLPSSQVSFVLLSKTGNLEDIVGTEVDVFIIEVDQLHNRLILSQRSKVSEELKLKLSQFKRGQQVKGKVVAIMAFGIALGLDGVEGVIFTQETSWEKVEDLNKIFKVGQEVEAVVVEVDEVLGRVNLSLRQLSEDPFIKLSEKLQVDDTVKGPIVNITPAGVVVSLEDGLEGFIPSSKLEGINFEVGQPISAIVDSVDKAKRRINLVPFLTTTKGLIYK